MKIRRIRLAVLTVASLFVVPILFCVASPATVPPVQAQDATKLYLQSLINQRDSELAATAAAVRAAQQTRQAEQQATAFALSVRQTEDARVANLTATARADEIKSAQATATQEAEQTATAAASATQAAAATAEAATAVAQQTASAFAVEATRDANDAQNRQRLINQGLQTARVVSYFVLIALGITLCVVMWRYVRPQQKPVVVVQPGLVGAEAKPEPPPDDDDEGADVTNDPRATAYVIDLLKQQESSQ